MNRFRNWLAARIAPIARPEIVKVEPLPETAEVVDIMGELDPVYDADVIRAIKFARALPLRRPTWPEGA